MDATLAHPSIDFASPQRRAWPLLMGHVLLIILLIGFFQARIWSGQTIALQIGPASVVLMGCCVWMLVSWRRVNGSLFDPYGLFIMAAMPFHAGYSFLRLIGQDAALLAGTGISEPVLARTLLLTLAGMAGLHLGALLLRAWSDSSDSGGSHRPAVAPQDLRAIGWLLIAVAIVPTALEFRGYLDAVFAGGYTELFLERQRATVTAGSTIVDLFTPFFLPGIYFLLAGSRESRVGRLAALGLLGVYALAFLYVGFRAYAFFPLAVGLWVWHVSIRPLPLRWLGVAGVTLFLLVAPLVRTFRGLAGPERFSLEALVSAYTSVENPVLKLIAELGSSLFTISYTTELVPAVRPHEWGLGYMRALFNAVPIVDIPNAYGDAGVWLAWEIRPDWAAGGFAYGYSFIAESFLNFGYLGAPLFLILLGAGIAGIARWAIRTQDASRVAFLAAFLPVLLFFVRGESVNLARPILWYALIPLALAHLLSRYRRRIGV